MLEHPGANELAAIVDPNVELAGRVAAGLGGAKVYPSHEALLAGERLDLVSICTPDDLHRAPAEAVARKGVNLFIEKPIASSLEDAKAIIAATRSAGVKLGVGYLLRFDPRYARARELIDEGKIGDPIHLYARRNSARTEGPKRYAGELPLALHVTVHDVDLVLWMLRGQRPVSVYAQQTDRLLGPIGTQDSIAAIVRFSEGMPVASAVKRTVRSRPKKAPSSCCLVRRAAASRPCCTPLPGSTTSIPAAS